MERTNNELINDIKHTIDILNKSITALQYRSIEKISISDCSFTYRVESIIHLNIPKMYHKIEYLDELSNFTEKELLRVKGVAKKTIWEIKTKLDKYGLQLTEEV